MENNILSVKELTKKYDKFQLNSISFNVKKGRIVGFIGNNGAGKTTTIRCILGLAPYQSGEIKVNDISIKNNEEKYKSLIGVVFDSGNFYESFTLEQMKSIVCAAYKNWDDEVYNKYMEKYLLRGDSKIKTLSKGMRMKYALALAMSHNAEVLVLDEPSSGLDPKSRDQLCEELLEQKEKGKTIFFSTHITSDLDKIGDDIILIENGSILFNGQKAKFLEESGLKSANVESAMLKIIKDSINR